MSEIKKANQDLIPFNTIEELSVSQYFPGLVLNPKDYAHIQRTKDEVEELSVFVRFIRHGASAKIPMKCGGKACPLKHTCPLWSAEETAEREKISGVPKLPIGKTCPIEFAILRQMAHSYAEEFQVAQDSEIDKRICLELAELEVLEYRMNCLLALPENASLIGEETVGFDKTSGEFLTKSVVSKFIDIKFNYIGRRKDRLLESMVATRGAKWRKTAALGESMGPDPARQFQQIKAKIDKLRDQSQSADAESSKPE